MPQMAHVKLAIIAQGLIPVILEQIVPLAATVKAVRLNPVCVILEKCVVLQIYPRLMDSVGKGISVYKERRSIILMVVTLPAEFASGGIIARPGVLMIPLALLENIVMPKGILR